MNPETFWSELHNLTDEYRPRCLWFLRKDFYPTDRESALRTIDYIQQHGDVTAFKRAGKLKLWLLQHSNEASAE